MFVQQGRRAKSKACAWKHTKSQGSHMWNVQWCLFVHPFIFSSSQDQGNRIKRASIAWCAKDAECLFFSALEDFASMDITGLFLGIQPWNILTERKTFLPRLQCLFYTNIYVVRGKKSGPWHSGVFWLEALATESESKEKCVRGEKELYFFIFFGM